ncbi:MAG: type II secretion system F family protein [Sulfolobales archaeon]
MTASEKTKIIVIIIIFSSLFFVLIQHLAVSGYVKFYTIAFLNIPYGYSFTTMLSMSLLLLYSLLTIATLPDMRKFKSVESQISNFISNVAVYLKSGTTLYQAISLAKRDLRGYFKDVVEKMDTMISLGASLDDAIDSVLRDLGHEYGYTIRILSVAMRSGGKSVDVVEKASNLLSYFQSYRDYRRRVFRQYLFLLVLVVIVYDFTVAFIYLILNSLAMTEALFIIKPDTELIYTLLCYISVIVSLVSGISYGKSIEGSVVRAFHYVLLFSTLNFILIHILPIFVSGFQF